MKRSNAFKFDELDFLKKNSGKTIRLGDRVFIVKLWV